MMRFKFIASVSTVLALTPLTVFGETTIPLPAAPTVSTTQPVVPTGVTPPSAAPDDASKIRVTSPAPTEYLAGDLSLEDAQRLIPHFALSQSNDGPNGSAAVHGTINNECAPGLTITNNDNDAPLDAAVTGMVGFRLHVSAEGRRCLESHASEASPCKSGNGCYRFSDNPAATLSLESYPHGQDHGKIALFHEDDDADPVQIVAQEPKTPLTFDSMASIKAKTLRDRQDAKVAQEKDDRWRVANCQGDDARNAYQRLLSQKELLGGEITSMSKALDDKELADLIDKFKKAKDDDKADARMALVSWENAHAGDKKKIDALLWGELSDRAANVKLDDADKVEAFRQDLLNWAGDHSEDNLKVAKLFEQAAVRASGMSLGDDANGGIELAKQFIDDAQSLDINSSLNSHLKRYKDRLALMESDNSAKQGGWANNTALQQNDAQLKKSLENEVKSACKNVYPQQQSGFHFQFNFGNQKPHTPTQEELTACSEATQNLQALGSIEQDGRTQDQQQIASMGGNGNASNPFGGQTPSGGLGGAIGGTMPQQGGGNFGNGTGFGFNNNGIPQFNSGNPGYTPSLNPYASGFTGASGSGGYGGGGFYGSLSGVGGRSSGNNGGSF